MASHSLKAEIIAVGTELLMGEVVNTNAAYLSKELAALGIDVYYHNTVGDNPKRIQGVFEEALKRSNILLVTGGLGPTDDDLTVSTLADLFETPMISDPHNEERIRKFFIARDMPMSNTNLKQALRPEDAEVVDNPVGTAPGIYWDVSSKTKSRGWSDGPSVIVTMPGVPREMTAMWEQTVSPKLHKLSGSSSVLVTRFLKFMGIGESMLAEKLRDLMAQASPTVSPYVGQAEVKIRIAAKGDSEQDALKQIEPVEAEILKRVGEYYYGKDDETLESVIGSLLKSQGKTIAVAESCTGGLVSNRLTNIPGSSNYIKLNVVTYANEAKEQILNVSHETLAKHGAVSEQTAKEMAEGILKLANSDIAVSITGIAGPDGGSDEKPVGLAYIGIAQLGKETLVKKVTVNSKYGREHIKFWFSHYALNFVRTCLLNH